MSDIIKSDEAPGLVFPCSIKVKIFINNHADDEDVVQEFIVAHLEAHHLVEVSSRVSSGGKYRAISATVDAQSREHIDGFYQALTDHQHVIMLI